MPKEKRSAERADRDIDIFQICDMLIYHQAELLGVSPPKSITPARQGPLIQSRTIHHIDPENQYTNSLNHGENNERDKCSQVQPDEAIRHGGSC